MARQTAPAAFLDAVVGVFDLSEVPDLDGEPLCHLRPQGDPVPRPVQREGEDVETRPEVGR